MLQGQAGLFFVFGISDFKISQEEQGLGMPSHDRSQLSRNILSLAPESTHTANQSVFADHNAQTVGPFAQSGKGFIELQEASHLLAAQAQLFKHDSRALANQLCPMLDESNRYSATVLKGDQ
jgi:hypothetical protein